MIKYSVLILIVLAVSVNAKPGVGIIGGKTAKAGQFPFAAAITKSTSTGSYFCAGTLFKNKWVITSGQCVDEAQLFTIRIGSNSLSSNDANAVRLSTDIYYLHPEFNKTTLENDIGLIQFRLAITYTEYIKPVSLLSTIKIPDYTSVITLGWGQTSDETSGLVDELNYVYLTTLSNDECKLTYGNQITDNMVCAEGNYNEGTCKGDLGSPMILYGGALTYLVGVSSFISANGCESTDPSGFTRIGPYGSWISNITKSNSVYL
ncbi:serine protease H119 [Tribolium castaneum]|uniref:Serine protease H119 n=2 Tax=Tribolium castaneum TaxID=7070 RepID=D6WN58_TRICA|nr:serine protease H119 [Tribolium castaneum]